MKEIVLFSNYFGNFEDDLKILFESLNKNNNMEFVDLSDYFIGKNESDFYEIIDFLRKTCLFYVDFGYNDNFVIKDEDRINLLAESVKKNSFLKNLYLNNSFDSDYNKKLINKLLSDRLKIYV